MSMEEMIPGLPDEMARECLVRVPFDRFASIRSVCRLWRKEVESSFFHRLRQAAGLTRSVLVLSQAEPCRTHSGPARKYAAPAYRLVIFDPEDSVCVPLPAIPWMTRGLPLFCQLAAVRRELVVLGGWDPDTWTACSSVFVYDFVTGEWRCGSNMQGPRRSFFACSVAQPQNVVVVAGGHDEEKNALRSAFAYDVAADTWTSLPDMARERDECRGVCIDGKLHVVGGYSTDAQGRFGDSVEAFDARAWAWEDVPETKLETGTCPRTCVAGGEGKMYMCSPAGKLLVSNGGGTWKTVAELPEDVKVGTQAAAWGEKVVVVGSGSHGGELAAYILNVGGERSSHAWRKTAVPAGFSGHVQALCYFEL